MTPIQSMETAGERLTEVQPADPMVRRSRGAWPRGVLCYLIAAAFTGFCLFPFYIIITTALKTETDIFAWPPVWLFKPTFQSFFNALFVFGGRSALSYLINSIVITAVSTFLAVGLGAMAAYGLERFPFTGSRQLAFWILSTRFAPPVAFIVPIYLMVQKVGLLDSHIALILIYTAMNLSLVVWILRGFFAEIPIEIEEAALVDGYSRLQIFWRIAFPLVRPGIISTALLSAIFSWNEFLYAIVLAPRNAATLPVYLAGFSSSMGLAWGEYMAIGTLAVLPILIFTFTLQKYLVRGLTFGATK
ncbi:MAG TPA: carbohydrate ABC transporter permease [Chthoniobacterales bacterium]|nr:carbohydrate ABC transporter permease [Chthoniobacterales bacterium]